MQSTSPQLTQGSDASTNPSTTTGNVSLDIQCRDCHKSFSRPENLARHVRAVHTRDAKYQCPYCRKRFTRSDLLKKHSNLHIRVPSVSVTQDTQSATVPAETQGLTDIPTADTYPRVEPAYVPLGVNDAVVAAQPNTVGFLARTGVDSAPSNVFNITQLAAQTTQYGGGPSYGEGLFDIDLAWTFDYLFDENTNYISSQPSTSVNPSSTFPQIQQVPEIGSRLGVGILPESDGDRIDWPDGQSRPASPMRRNDFPLFRLAAFVDGDEINHASITYTAIPKRCVALTSENIHDIFEPVLGPRLQDFCPQGPEPEEIPTVQSLQHFLLLYFIHVDFRFPVIHQATFSSQTCSHEMLLSMILAGSCHSTSNRGMFCRAYLERARMVATLNREKDRNYLKSIEHLHSFFLLSLVATWSGLTEAYLRAEADRGILISACRRSRLLDCRLSSPQARSSTSTFGQAKLQSDWMWWIETERRKRLGLSIYILDCQYAALLQRQPYISKAETTNTSLPCLLMYWQAPSAQGWKMLFGAADTPPSIYHLPTLSSVLLGHLFPDTDSIHFPPLDDFSKLFYMYVIHSHIFEWRQAVCMINSTGLRDTPVSLGPEDIGPGLIDRHLWLTGALETWLENYGPGTGSGTEDSALDMDLHVVAGRSGSQEDILLAAESLRNRLSSDTSYRIMKHVLRMLNIAFAVVEKGQAEQCSFEVAVSLFMGGLVCWAIHHTLQRQELDNYLTSIRSQPSPNFPRGLLDGPSDLSGEQSVLMYEIRRVIKALRDVHYLGFASIFSSVLNKLCQNQP